MAWLQGWTCDPELTNQICHPLVTIIGQGGPMRVSPRLLLKLLGKKWGRERVFSKDKQPPRDGQNLPENKANSEESEAK